MNKFIIFIQIFFIIGCKMNSQKPSKIKVINPHYKSDSLLLWGSIKYDDENVFALIEVKKRYSIKEGKLYDKFQKSEVTGLAIQLRKNDTNIILPKIKTAI